MAIVKMKFLKVGVLGKCIEQFYLVTQQWLLLNVWQEKQRGLRKTFAAELVVVSHLRHKNHVRLRGWCVHEDQLLLVEGYMPTRSQG